MPVRKFRTFEEASDALVMDRDDPLLPRRLAWALSLGTRLDTRQKQLLGVRNYRSLVEAQADRERLDVEGQEETPPAVSLPSHLPLDRHGHRLLDSKPLRRYRWLGAALCTMSLRRCSNAMASG